MRRRSKIPGRLGVCNGLSLEYRAYWFENAIMEKSDVGEFESEIDKEMEIYALVKEDLDLC